MNAKTVFRSLVLTTCVLPLVVFPIGSFAFSALPAPLAEYLQSQQRHPPAVPASPFDCAFALGIVLVIVSVFIGLWRFRPIARIAYCAGTVLYVVWLPFMGHLVLPALLTPVFYLSYLCQGALLAMAYLPPVADEFARRKA